MGSLEDDLDYGLRLERQKKEALPAQQEWVCRLPIMQQSVLFAAIRAPDGIRKDHPVKVLCRWYRRCILLSAFDRRALTDPFEEGGGSFTGPFTSEHVRDFFGPNETVTHLRPHFDRMKRHYLRFVDELPHHFQLHFMHAAQIIGVHHPVLEIRTWWWDFYLLIVNDAHLFPESPELMNKRLSDDSATWREREVVVAR